MGINKRRQHLCSHWSFYVVQVLLELLLKSNADLYSYGLIMNNYVSIFVFSLNTKYKQATINILQSLYDEEHNCPAFIHSPDEHITAKTYCKI